MTQRALLSEKSMPSDARPRQTASRRPPLTGKYGEFDVFAFSFVSFRFHIALTRFATAEIGLTEVNVPLASRKRSEIDVNVS